MNRIFKLSIDGLNEDGTPNFIYSGFLADLSRLIYKKINSCFFGDEDLTIDQTGFYIFSGVVVILFAIGITLSLLSRI